MQNASNLVQTPQELDLYIKLQRAIDASGGLLHWTDVLLGIRRAKEKKLAEAVGTLVSSLSLADLFLAEEVAFSAIEFVPITAAVPNVEPTIKINTSTQNQEAPQTISGSSNSRIPAPKKQKRFAPFKR